MVCEAPKCNTEISGPTMEFNCKYFGSERVNFSRGKQIADLAISKLKTADQNANGQCQPILGYDIIM